MRIKKVSIKNYRSIVEINSLYLQDDLTTLVGANEHGKSNVLSSLLFIEPDSRFVLERDCRIDQDSNIHYPSIEYTLSLNEEEKALLDLRLDVLYTKPENENKQVEKIAIPAEIIFVRGLNELGEIIDVPQFADAEYKNDVVAFIFLIFKGKVIYFDEFEKKLISRLPHSELINRENQIVNGLLRLAGLEAVRDRLFEDSGKIRNLLDKSSSKLSEAIRKNWFQGQKDNLSIKLDINHQLQVLVIDIVDKNAHTPFEARSRGFKWYLSFFLNYRAYSDGDLKDCLFLLDEPGLFLHPRGQKDLLNFFEAFSKHNQIVYSTHSPFMINRLKQRRVRVVEKNEANGTSIDSKGFISNWRPVRTSLGLALSDSFYYADNTLLVEGPEDKIYILCLLKLYAEQTNKNIDLNILSIMDTGGASELPPMARIIKSEERPLIILIDSDSEDEKAELDELFEDKNVVIEIKDFDKKATTIQDLLPKNIWELAVNKYIDRLVESETIQPKGKKEIFSASSDTKIDKDAELFAIKNYGVKRFSKVGIAYEFEEIIFDNSFKLVESEFKKCFKLIERIIQELNLEITEH
jgi:predicted ATP-dependent endonuclease of OLD family